MNDRQHFMTAEHDADIAYYEAEVRTARKGSLNPAEWPELEREVQRIQEVRRVINALSANPDFRIPPSPAELAMYDTTDEGGEARGRETPSDDARLAADIIKLRRFASGYCKYADLLCDFDHDGMERIIGATQRASRRVAAPPDVKEPTPFSGFKERA